MNGYLTSVFWDGPEEPCWQESPIDILIYTILRIKASIEEILKMPISINARIPFD